MGGNGIEDGYLAIRFPFCCNDWFPRLTGSNSQVYDTKTHTRLHSETKVDAPHFFLNNLRSHAGSEEGATPLLQIEVSQGSSLVISLGYFCSGVQANHEQRLADE